MAAPYRAYMSLLPAAGVISQFCFFRLALLCPSKPLCATNRKNSHILASSWTGTSGFQLRLSPRRGRSLMAGAGAKQVAEDDIAQLSSGTSFRKRVEILNHSGQKLVGYLDDTGSEDVVILCHGFRSSKDSGTLGIVASAILQAGISVFRFDFSGNGESEGEFGYGNFWDEVEDLRSVVLHWRVEGRKVHQIVGHSKGGCAVLLYASKYQDVSTVVNVSGRCFTENGVKERLGEEGLREVEEKGYFDVNDRFGSYRITKRSLENRIATNMELEVVKIPTSCRVYTVHGSDDDVVPVEDALEFDKLIVNHKLNIIEGGDHRFRSHITELGQGVLEHIQAERSGIASDNL